MFVCLCVCAENALFGVPLSVLLQNDRRREPNAQIPLIIEEVHTTLTLSHPHTLTPSHTLSHPHSTPSHPPRPPRSSPTWSSTGSQRKAFCECQAPRRGWLHSLRSSRPASDSAAPEAASLGRRCQTSRLCSNSSSGEYKTVQDFSTHRSLNHSMCVCVSVESA